MIFEKLGDTITKHPKATLLIWVVLLIAAAWPAMHASESFDYDSTNVGADDSEAMKGAQIMKDNFDSMIDTSNMQSILITYDANAYSKTQMKNIEAAIIPSIKNSDSKIIAITEGGLYDSGLLMLAVMYDTSLSAEQISNDTGNLRKALKDALAGCGEDTSGLTTYVTGSPAITYDTKAATTKDLSIVDPIAIFMIIVLVGLFFRSFLSSAAAPMVIGVALSVVLGLIFFLGQLIAINSIAQMILIVSMLGAGCDYCIFILSRYREERRSGKDHVSACKEAITWAGESVATSGIAVMIGFGAMSLCSFSMVSSMGIVLALGIVIAILAALTMMSSVLVLLGDRLFWPTGAASPKLEKGYVRKFGNLADRYFRVSTRFSLKHAKAIVIAAVLFTVPMVYVYATSEDSYDMIGSMMSGESADGMTVMQDYVGSGSVMPNYALVETENNIAVVTYLDQGRQLGSLTWNDSETYSKNVSEHLKTYATQIQNNDNNIKSATTFDRTLDWFFVSHLFYSDADPDVPNLFDPALVEKMKEVADQPIMAEYKSAINNLIMLVNALNTSISSEVKAALDTETAHWSIFNQTVTKIMDWGMFVKSGNLGYTVDETTGVANVRYAKISISTTEMALSNNSIDSINKISDYIHGKVNDDVLLKTVWVSGTTAVMVDVSETIGSEFLKIELVAVILIIILLFVVMRSYLTPIRSVITILMSVIWTVAITHLLFTNVLGAGVLWLVPIILLVVCLGLGMDYDILLTTRIKEYVHSKGMTNDEAIENAVLHSGSVITICGIIMGGTFGSMMLASTGMLQQMGFALCFAILCDALIVRTYIVPAAMHLMGEWNWKGPAFMHRNKE